MTTTQHTVAIQQVLMVLEGARHRGLDEGLLLGRAGIPQALLSSRLARVPQHQYAALLRVLRRALRDEFWGLATGRMPPGSFGQCMKQAVRCRTLGEALRRGFAHYHLLLPDFVARLTERDDTAQLRFVLQRTSDERLDYAVKAFMLFTFGVASWLVARRIPVLGVDYTAEATGGPDSSRIYNAPIRHGQAHIGLLFDAYHLGLPIAQTPESLRGFLAGAPGNLMVSYRDSSSLIHRIRRLLRNRLSDENSSLEMVSDSLGMTPQTLRRRLRQEGRGFQRIKDELRRDLAIEYLTQTQLPLLDIANHIGFSEASPFHRAFKTWTGVAPGEYRSTHLHGIEQ